MWIVAGETKVDNHWSRNCSRFPSMFLILDSVANWDLVWCLNFINTKSGLEHREGEEEFPSFQHV